MSQGISRIKKLYYSDLSVIYVISVIIGKSYHAKIVRRDFKIHMFMEINSINSLGDELKPISIEMHSEDSVLSFCKQRNF